MEGGVGEEGAAARALAPVAVEEVADRIYRLPVPVPFEVGPVNCYLIRRGEPVLIDTAPRTDGSYGILREHLATLGVAAEDLRHIVITHAHIDHHGNLRRLADASGAALYAHEDDADQIFEYWESIDLRARDLRALVRFWGFPLEVMAFVEEYWKQFKVYAEPVSRDRYRPVRGEGSMLRLGPDVELRAIHCPGHTEGLICLLMPSDGLLFSTDHVLEDITPNPTAYLKPYRGRRTGLAHYLESLDRLRKVAGGGAATKILPGHGPPFGSLDRRLDEIRKHHAERSDRIVELLAEAGAGAGATVLDLIQKLWKGLKPGDYYLACREVNGHLDILVEEGRVRHELEGDVGRYRVSA